MVLQTSTAKRPYGRRHHQHSIIIKAFLLITSVPRPAELLETFNVVFSKTNLLVVIIAFFLTKRRYDFLCKGAVTRNPQYMKPGEDQWYEQARKYFQKTFRRDHASSNNMRIFLRRRPPRTEPLIFNSEFEFER
jgi:hypothetical protein